MTSPTLDRYVKLSPGVFCSNEPQAVSGQDKGMYIVALLSCGRYPTTDEVVNLFRETADKIYNNVITLPNDKEERNAEIEKLAQNPLEKALYDAKISVLGKFTSVDKDVRGDVSFWLRRERRNQDFHYCMTVGLVPSELKLPQEQTNYDDIEELILHSDIEGVIVYYDKTIWFAGAEKTLRFPDGSEIPAETIFKICQEHDWTEKMLQEKATTFARNLVDAYNGS